MISLKIRDLSGKENEQECELTKPKLYLGRDTSNDIVLRHSKVSRKHALFIKEGDTFSILDLQSSNGTLVNNDRITTRRVLAHGDVIRIADFEMSVRSSTVAQQTPGYKNEHEITKDHQISAAAPVIKKQASAQISSKPSPQSTQISNTDSSLDKKRMDILFEIRREIHRRLLQYMDLRKMDFSKIQDLQLRQDTKKVIDDIIIEISDDIPSWVDRKLLAKDVLDEALGLGPIEDFLADETITEVMVNSAELIYVERFGKLEKVNKKFSSNEAVLAVIERIVGPMGRRIDESSPYVDARLKDGSRVNAIIPPLAISGPTITIRKFSRDPFTIKDLIRFGTFTQEVADFMRATVFGRRNVIISGGTGSGKTTLLNVVSAFIPDHERIITIEDAAELQLPQEHVVSLEARPANIEGKGAIPIRELVRNSLRMRPDRIVVGECRGAEALDMLQAMNTGHEGSISTIHANSPTDSLHRLETMVLMAGVDMPIRAIRDQITSAINIIIQTHRFSDGSRKVTNISEIRGYDEREHINVVPLIKFFQTGLSEDNKILGYFGATGEVPIFIDEFKARGILIDRDIFKAGRILGENKTHD